MINWKILRMFLRFQRHPGSLLKVDWGQWSDAWAIPKPERGNGKHNMIKVIIVSLYWLYLSPLYSLTPITFILLYPLSTKTYSISSRAGSWLSNYLAFRIWIWISDPFRSPVLPTSEHLNLIHTPSPAHSFSFLSQLRLFYSFPHPVLLRLFCSCSPHRLRPGRVLRFSRRVSGGPWRGHMQSDQLRYQEKISREVSRYNQRDEISPRRSHQRIGQIECQREDFWEDQQNDQGEDQIRKKLSKKFIEKISRTSQTVSERLDSHRLSGLQRRCSRLQCQLPGEKH